MKNKPSLTHMSDDELLSLNHEIIDLLMARQREEKQNDLSAFGVGERVSFQGPEGQPISGTIKRVNQKTITVVTDYGQWKIDPCFVLKDKPAKAVRGKVLTLHRND